MKFIKIFSLSLLISVCCLSSLSVAAQMVASPEPFDNSAPTANDPQADLPDPCTGPDSPCPIDGGVVLLIAAGIGIAGKRAYHK